MEAPYPRTTTLGDSVDIADVCAGESCGGAVAALDHHVVVDVPHIFFAIF